MLFEQCSIEMVKIPDDRVQQRCKGLAYDALNLYLIHNPYVISAAAAHRDRLSLGIAMLCFSALFSLTLSHCIWLITIAVRDDMRMRDADAV
jgi:hypothetical protein